MTIYNQLEYNKYINISTLNYNVLKYYKLVHYEYMNLSKYII